MFPVRAIYLEKTRSGATTAAIRQLDDGDFPASEHDVVLDVAYSSLNYKDALAITGRSPVVRRFPMVPGIDLAGTVAESRSAKWQRGDEVLVTGYEIGEVHWGGLARRARVKSEWLVRKPETMTLFETMAVGTAGFTAALAMTALEAHGGGPDAGPVLVTGATGGVGSIGIMLLAASGYTVAASTGKSHEADYLRQLGAREIVDRGALSAPGKPLQRERWAGAIDSVGSHTLANVCASMKPRGVVAACGLAQGMDFPATVAPFILRGVTLAGVSSVMTPMPERLAAWQKIERLIAHEQLRGLAREIGLEEALDLSPQVLAGAVRGRLVVNVNR
ncbi:MAG: MDR family oxidoreductase [Vicinamibacterales bacterium]